MVTKLQGDKATPQSSMELYDPWISGPPRFLTICYYIFSAFQALIGTPHHHNAELPGTKHQGRVHVRSELGPIGSKWCKRTVSAEFFS